ncbi:hypothetical protein HYR99_00800 [Candidatus Poribacteria bacterium]|nr:hypothetical protein [Candidatus Poribacteria bacterium]
MPVGGALKGGETEATRRGRRIHKGFKEKVQQKKGWISEPQNLMDPKTGKKVVPDALDPKGRPVELKPNTPGGRRAGRQQMEKYERATRKKGRVIYYEP